MRVCQCANQTIPQQDLETLYEQLLEFSRNSPTDADGQISPDLPQLAAKLESASPKVLSYGKYARIAQGMLRSEAGR